MNASPNDPLILIVEDDDDLRRLLELQVQKLGYRTALAADGKEGFEKAQELMPALMLLDLMMPVMDGFQVLKRMKCLSSLADTPVLILTASHDDHHRKKGLSHMCDGFLTKPYRVDVLRENIERLLPQTASR